MSRPFKKCPRCQTPAELEESECRGCGRQYKTTFLAPTNQPEPTQVFSPQGQQIPPAPPAYQAAQPYHPPQLPPTTPHRNLWPSFIIALLVPIAGLVWGLIRAFDSRPEFRREAGYQFAGMAAGVALYIWAGASFWPAVALGPGGPAYERGVEASTAERWREAEVRFEEAVGTDPELAIAWLNLSFVQGRLQDGPGAERSARKAISLIEGGGEIRLPKGETRTGVHAYAYGNLAVGLLIQGRDGEARAAAARALNLDPNSPKAGNWRQIAPNSGL